MVGVIWPPSDHQVGLKSLELDFARSGKINAMTLMTEAYKLVAG